MNTIEHDTLPVGLQEATPRDPTGLGSLALGVMLRFGPDIADVTDTNGDIHAGMKTEQVYEQVGIVDPSISKDQMRALDDNASDIASLLNTQEAGPEDKLIIDELVTEGMSELEASLEASRTIKELIKVARNPRESDTTKNLEGVIDIDTIEDESGFLEGLKTGEAKPSVRPVGENESVQLKNILGKLKEQSYTGGKKAPSILNFRIPSEPIRQIVTIKAPVSGREYKIINLVSLGDNDHCDGQPDLSGLGSSISNTIGQIDNITEGAAAVHGDIADYGTRDLDVSGEALTVRRMKMDDAGGIRVPMYAVFSRSEARGSGEPASRILVIASRTTAAEHDELHNAMKDA